MGGSKRRQLKRLEQLNKPEYFHHHITQLQEELGNANRTPQGSETEENQYQEDPRQEREAEQPRRLTQKEKHQEERNEELKVRRNQERRFDGGEEVPIRG